MRDIKFRAWNPFNNSMYYLTGDDTAVSTKLSYDLGLWASGWEVYEISANGKQICVASETRQGHKGGELPACTIKPASPFLKVIMLKPQMEF